MKCKRGFIVAAILVLSHLYGLSAYAERIFTITPTGGVVNTKELQEALTAASDGDTIILSPGIYKQDPIIISKKLRIIGASGEGVVIEDSGNGSSGALIMLTPGSSGTIISGITVVPAAASTAVHGIASDGTVTDITISNIIVNNFRNSGIYLKGTQHATITDIEARNNGGAGLFLSDARDVTIANISTSGNSAGGIGIEATAASAVDAISVIGSNRFGESSFGTCGMYLASPAGVELTFSDIMPGSNVTVQGSDFTYVSPALSIDGNVVRKFFASAADATRQLGGTIVPLPLAGETADHTALVGQLSTKLPQGPKGETGDIGPAGPQGEKGPPGPPGPVDTQGDILAKIGTQADGAILRLQQGPAEQLDTVKFTVKDSSGKDEFSVRANGAVAIGTTSGTSPLTIDSGIATAVPPGGASLLVVGNSNKERVEINSFGPVTDSAPTFQGKSAVMVNGIPNTRATQVLMSIGGSGYDNNGNRILPNMALIQFLAEEQWMSDAHGTNILFHTTSSGTTTRSEKMRITGSGNLGIGATAPAQKLEVNGGIRLNTSTAKPSCTSSARGTFWVTQGTTNDVVEVCVMISGTMNWKVLQVQ